MVIVMIDKPQQVTQDSAKKDALSLLIDRNPCGICRAFRVPICMGHGSGGGSSSGGGDSGGSGGSNGSSNEANSSAPIAKAAINTFDNSLATTADYSDISSLLQLNNREFNFEVIIELLAKKIFSIENNSELGILTIKCSPALCKLLSEEQKAELKKFIDVIQHEFNDFKTRNGIIDQSYSITLEKDHQDNILSLTIKINNPKLYDAFIKHLTKNLISIDLPDQEERNRLENPKKSSIPNPFDISRGPRPEKWRKEE
jgi:hypothetical protein